MKELTLEVTQKCLNNCVYCSSCSNSKSKYMISYGHCKSILHDAKELGFTQVNISGGEPFLHPEIEDILKYAHELNFKIVVYSSGLTYIGGLNDDIKILNGDLFSAINETVINKCTEYIDKIVFNMQAELDNLHSEITGQNRDQLCRDTSIKRFINKGIETEVNIVPMKINLQNLRCTIDKAIDMGCSKVNLLGLVIQGRAKNNKDILLMNAEDMALLKNIINDVKIKYGTKIRIGSPLSDNSSERCTAGISRLTIRYDGMVFPCEAWKYKEVINDYSPMNIKNYSLDLIIKNSKFLDEINKIITNDKNCKCSDCPAQKDLGYKCAFDKNSVVPDFLSETFQDSKDIFISHMKGFLSTNYEDMNLLKMNTKSINDELKEKLIKKNYLFCNKSALDITDSAYLLVSKESEQVKVYVPDKIKISKELYDSILNSELKDMNNFRFNYIESNEYNLYLEPYFNTDMIDNYTKRKFISEYLESVTYPDKFVIKHSIAVVMSSSNLFEDGLINKGFEKIKDSGIYKIYGYITANQFCKENLITISRGLK